MVERRLTGWHVLAIFGSAFSVIISVNMVLAYQAVNTFPGLEVKNSYVASQRFDRDRAAQLALGWAVSAELAGSTLILKIDAADGPVQPTILRATFGRATHVGEDQSPAFTHNGEAFIADVGEIDHAGNWNLRLVAEAETGQLFRQRIVVRDQ